MQGIQELILPSRGQIANKYTLKEANNQRKNYGLKHSDIEKTYKDIGIIAPSDKPFYSQRGEAREWLIFGSSTVDFI